MRFVPTASVEPGMVVGRDIVTKKTAAMVKKGVVLMNDHIQYLETHGYLGVYISDALSEDIQVKSAISDALMRESIDAIAGEDVDAIIAASTKMVTELMNDDEMSLDLIDLRSYDDYTYHHSLNVALYSVAIGKQMGLLPDKLNHLSLAALAHDLGKMHIPAELLNKPGKISDEEYELIKSHPQLSIDVLTRSNTVSAVVKQAILLHHENENGSGYPLHKQGDEIPLLAKIIHAADVFDALTSRRPYKEPYAPAAAFEYLKGGCDILFDRKVVEAMLHIIPAYPPGTDVKLSDGRDAIVVGHSGDVLRPKVKITYDGQIIDLMHPINRSIVIVDSSLAKSSEESRVTALNEKRNHATAKPRIIVVDDMMVSILQTKMALGEDFEILQAQSGLDALDLLKNKPSPDLFIIDIEMPNMDGHSLARTLHNKGYDAPIIFLTARADKETVMKCIAIGATDYIVKPALPVYLRERVNIALNIERE